MNGFKADDLDVYRLKTAATDRERVQVMQEAVAKAVERAQINYLLFSVTIAVLLVVLVQSLTIMEINPVPVDAYKWCVLVMVGLVVLPWQLRRLRVFG
jgi:hypothetical protein